MTPLPEKNKETQQTNVHAFSGIRILDPSNQSAAEYIVDRMAFGVSLIALKVT
jgi:hypothetical protein